MANTATMAYADDFRFADCGKPEFSAYDQDLNAPITRPLTGLIPMDKASPDQPLIISPTHRDDGEITRDWFAEQVTELSDSMFRTAQRMVDNRAVAEDLVADAVLKALSSLEQLHSKANFKAWMFTILVNGVRSLCRKQGREVSLDTQGETQDDGNFWLFEQLHQPFLLWWGNPEQQFLDNLAEKDFQQAIQDLPEKYKLVASLILIEECSYEEAAMILNIPVGTVRSSLNRARSMMQRTLWQYRQSTSTGQGEINNDH